MLDTQATKEGITLLCLFKKSGKIIIFEKKPKKVIFFFATTEIVIKFATPFKRDVL
mgnify:CR=1 FL=1